MPFVIKFVEQGKGIEFRGSGFLTEDELVEARTELQSDAEAMRRVTFALIDLRTLLNCAWTAKASADSSVLMNTSPN